MSITLPKNCCRPYDLLKLIKPTSSENVVIFNSDNDEFEELSRVQFEVDIKYLVEVEHCEVYDMGNGIKSINAFIYCD